MSRTQTSSPSSSGTASPTSDRSSVSGEEHSSNRDDLAGLETWEDPTPRPSTSFTVQELTDAWVAAAQRQFILKPKSPNREERIRRREEHDWKSLMIALNVYARENDIQPTELDLIAVKERNLIDDGGTGYVHFNFQVLRRLGDTSSVFFAEVHPGCREEDDISLCTPLEENDSGHCFGCKDRAQGLKHPSNGGYSSGHQDIVFPFMILESDEDED